MNLQENNFFPEKKKRIFVLGARGRLGATLIRTWKKSFPNVEVLGLGREEIDLQAPKAALEAMKACELTSGEVLINSAALTDVDRCQREPALAKNVNALTPALLASLAADRGVRFVQVSTDYVFDGLLERDYSEEDMPAPLSYYGVSKLEGEQGVLATSENHIVARVSWIFGRDRPSFIDQIIQRARHSKEVAAIDDKISSPSYTEDLARWFALFLKNETNVPGGIYHLCNSGNCSWRAYGEYALQYATSRGIPLLTSSVAPLKLAEMKNFLAPRPPRTSLRTTKFSTLLGHPLRSWQEALEEYITTFYCT